MPLQPKLSADDLLTEIYSSFEPFLPPPEGTYVNYEAVRGKWNVVRELDNRITRSKKPTCQLYSGHRGVGKTTELLRLKDHLEAKHYKVVYFAVDDEDVETQDAEYADIAKTQLPQPCKGIVIIVDNLDRISENNTDGRSNKDVTTDKAAWIAKESLIDTYAPVAAEVKTQARAKIEDPEALYQSFIRALRRRGFGILFLQCTPVQGKELLERSREDLSKRESSS